MVGALLRRHEKRSGADMGAIERPFCSDDGKLQRSYAGGIRLQQNIELDWNIRCVLVTYLYRRGLPQLIEADPVYTRGKIVGYDIHIFVPVEQLAA